MPTTASLRPTRVGADPKKSKRIRRAPWCLSVPPELSATGRRQRLFFATEREARVESEKLKARKDNFGLSLASLTPERIAQAGEAFKLLDPLNIGLLDAVRAHIALVKARSQSVTFGAAFNRFAELKKNKSPAYRQEIRYAKETFEPLLDRMICEITAADLEPMLDQLPGASRNAKIRRLCSVFNLAIRRGWFQGINPTKQIDRAEIARKEVEVFSPQEVESMLNYALKSDLEFLPYLTFATFCGIRPEGEMSKLQWSDLRFDGDKPIVLVPSGTSKTKRKRPVDVSENARAWLNVYRVNGGSDKGLIVRFSDTTLIRKRRQMCKTISLRWIQQGLRHSYCSYWLAIHHDVNRLVLQSGHDNPDTMWQHYFTGILESDAKKFWNIRPPQPADNVVPMARAS